MKHSTVNRIYKATVVVCFLVAGALFFAYFGAKAKTPPAPVECDRCLKSCLTELSETIAKCVDKGGEPQKCGEDNVWRVEDYRKKHCSTCDFKLNTEVK